MKYFEISVPRHIRFADLRKQIIRTTTFNKYACICTCNWTVEVRDVLIFLCISRNSRTTGTNPHQSVPSVTSQHVASSQTGTSVEMYRII